jgi:uncharacterized membrane protein
MAVFYLGNAITHYGIRHTEYGIRETTMPDQNRPTGPSAAIKRGIALAVVTAVLLLLAFYTITDTAHLTHSHLLNGSDWMGYAVCHRITERSFVINGRQFPLCARCSGMYLGVILVFLTLWLGGRLRWGALPRWPILLALLGFVAVMGLDGINSYLHFSPTRRTSTNRVTGCDC